jgi:iron(III) transport system substrate-binding protein
MKNATRLLLATAIAGLAPIIPAWAQGQVNVYCSNQIERCQPAAAEFQKATGIKVNLTQKSSGETLAQIRAEKENPRGDIWYAGTGDPHLIAAEEGLTVPYESPNLAKVHPWAKSQWEASGKRSTGVYSGALGFGINKELFAKKNLPLPQCWADLTKAVYKGEIQMANPNSSGTAYTMVATMVQIMGEEKAFDYMRTLHANINSYARSGAGPIKAAGRGETGMAIVFLHDVATEIDAGFPLEMVSPCEGTGYEIGSISMIRGGRNTEQAKKFYDWALTADAQKLYYTGGKSFQTPSAMDAPLPPGAPDITKIKLIDYDFVKYGSASERRRLLDRWDREVGALPK